MVVLRLASIDLRKRVGSTLVLAIVMGVAIGVVAAAAAGARRNATAYDRMLKATRASDVLVNPNNGTDSALDPDQVAKLPQVEEMGMIRGLFILGDKNGKPDIEGAETDSTIIAVADRGYLQSVDRPIVIAGRVPADDVLDEVAVSPDLAARRHLELGSPMVLHAFTVDEVRAADPSKPLPPGRIIRARVVGILRNNSDIVTDDANPTSALYMGGKARQLRADAFYGLTIRLRNGARDVPAVEREIDHLVPADARADGDTMVYQTRTDLIARVRRITGPQTIALVAFALVSALATLFVAAQAIARHLAARRDEVPVLSALGANRRTIFAVLLIRASVVTIAAAAVALVVASALSPLTPVGLGREVEPDRGLAVNVAVLVGVVGLFVALLLALVAVPAWRLARYRTSVVTDRAPFWSRVVRPQGRPSVALGVRNALAGTQGPLGASTRSAVIGTAVAVFWLVSVSVFAASLTHFVDSPREWGWHWDAMVSLNSSDNGGAGAPVDARREVAAILRDSPGIKTSSLGTTTELTLRGRRVTTVAMTPTATGMPATISDGRAPRRAGEVALGRRTMRELHTSIGSSIGGTDRQGHPYTARVVGQAVFPGLASYPGEDPTSLGSGALVTMDGWQRYGADLSGAIFFVDAEGGLPASTRAALHKARLPGSGEPAIGVVYEKPRRPSDVKGITQVRKTPYLLALLLGLLALLTVGHTLITDVRRRRHELAICKAIGFTRRQVASVVAWHATTVTVVGLLIGVPLGVLAGRQAWVATSDQLGIVPHPSIPVLLVVLVTVGIVVAANLLAAIPGRLAARIPPAEALRQE